MKNLKRKKKKKNHVFRNMVIIAIFVILMFKKNDIKAFTTEYIEKVKLERKQEKFIKENKWKQIFEAEDKMYPVIYEGQNIDYFGMGQAFEYEQDGYFTTFTTVEENKKIYKEYKQNGNSSWKNNEYWNSTMEESGCGITVLSTILSGYGYNLTPEDLRNKYYPSLNYNKLSKVLKKEYNIDNSDFFYDKESISKEKILEHLKTNKPIIICVWGKKDNRWTTTSHYMSILAADNNEKVYISNPNGLYNSSKSSGWYNINEVLPHIAKILFINK